MRSTLFLHFIVPLSLASPVKRDGSSIVASINKIESSISALNNALSSFQGGIPTVLGIQGKDIDLGNAIQDATDTAQQSAPLSDQESFQVAQAVSQLAPQIYSVLDAVVAHAHTFDTVIFGISSAYPQVSHDLQQQKGYSDAFAQAVTSKLTSQYAQAAPAVQQQIDAAFDKAIAVFQNPSGIPFPVLPDVPRIGGSSSMGSMQAQSSSSVSGATQPQGTSSSTQAASSTQPQGATQSSSGMPYVSGMPSRKRRA